MYAAYNDQIEFVIVYIEEAHPEMLEEGHETGVVGDPDDMDERVVLASACVSEFDFTIPMVGRQKEAEQIRSFLSRPAEGARVLAVSGQAGIGKSRLVYEVLQEQACKTVFTIECHPETSKSPYYVFAQLLRSYLGGERGEDVDVFGRMRLFSLRFPQFSDEDLVHLKYLLGDPAAIAALTQVDSSAIRATLKGVFHRFHEDTDPEICPHRGTLTFA